MRSDEECQSPFTPPKTNNLNSLGDQSVGVNSHLSCEVGRTVGLNARDDSISFDFVETDRQQASPTRRSIPGRKTAKKSVVFAPSAFDFTSSGKSVASAKPTVECVRTTTSSSSESSEDDILTKLENVTSLSRSLIPHFDKKMATQTTTAKSNRKKIFRKRLAMRRGSASDINEDEKSQFSNNNDADPQQPTPEQQDHQTLTNENETRRGVLQRLRTVSRSRSRSRASTTSTSDASDGTIAKPILVAVTSCRSDAYYNQKAPGSTSKLPRKAPSNLKLFHELAVGIKDAYTAVGQTPTRPDDQENESLTPAEREGRKVLWEFVGNLDFLLALVDEVATDTATRGALKDDSTFKSLRDVIKKCNKVLESMLIRRERRYTLFFRLVQPHEPKEIEKIRAWNLKVERAVGSVADAPNATDTESEAGSITSNSDASAVSGRGVGGIINRGRQMLPSAGRVRARRATPTPTLRNRRKSTEPTNDSVAGEDGFSNTTVPVTQGNLAMLQRSIDVDGDGDKKLMAPMISQRQQPAPVDLAPGKLMEPKDELIDVIRGLRTEKIQKRDGTHESDLAQLKPNWQPKAVIPVFVPKLPTEYIHRHRLMKQVVNCLLDQNGVGPRDTEEEKETTTIITSITSRHADKPGNGKTTLAVAAIQTVEVRERFCDGIAWIQLGRNPLTEKEVRRLYEELFRQLVSKGMGDDDDDEADETRSRSTDGDGPNESPGDELDRLATMASSNNAIRIAESRQRFQGGELDAIKEDLASIITKKRILICLDDVWRVDDAKWFIFDTRHGKSPPITRGMNIEEPYPYRILITTRTQSLFGAGVVQEVPVRIFSEHEAVKLLLSSAGRRPYGGKQSTVFNQARVIVKGCGNSPMAVRLAGGMLRRSNRNWNLSSPTWTMLMQQSKRNLEEASQLRSFVNSVTRVVDLSFATVQDMEFRIALRRCFITFAMAFRDNDWVQIGKGIPQAVIIKLFSAVLDNKSIKPQHILSALEMMNLLQRARHGTTSDYGNEVNGNEGNGTKPKVSTFIENPSFVMQDSIRTVGEEIAKRSAPAFLPSSDEFTSFDDEIGAEQYFHDQSAGILGGAMRFIVKQLSSKDLCHSGMQVSTIHELVIASLCDIDGRINKNTIIEAYKNTQERNKIIKGGDKLEEYMSVFLPSHLILSQAHVAGGELLVEEEFIRRRVRILGATEATRKHVTDLLELRREVSKELEKAVPLTQSENENKNGGGEVPSRDIDAGIFVRDGCKNIIEEVHRLVSNQKGTAESLGMAICLSTVGEGLLKAKQPRDAMLRLEEAVLIYRGLLGENHVDVARSLHSVARALVKLGENRVAVHKFAEAAEIYEKCDATMHFDSIANSQNLATLLIDLGEWDKAAERFHDVIGKKKAVHGDGSVSVAKTINSYAILLAKHGRMNEALLNYEAAKSTYEAVPPTLLQDQDFVVKCNYDVTLINLNIASIRSKKGDLHGAIESYEEGVRGLRKYESAQERAAEQSSGEANKNTSHTKHLVAALGRIGSLKLKVGDNSGALEAYQQLLNEVSDESPQASRVEKAKGHIKCATIYRQAEGREAYTKSISHLREALQLYTALFGGEHKDTLAIASSLRQWLNETQQDG